MLYALKQICISTNLSCRDPFWTKFTTVYVLGRRCFVSRARNCRFSFEIHDLRYIFYMNSERKSRKRSDNISLFPDSFQSEQTIRNFLTKLVPALATKIMTFLFHLEQNIVHSHMNDFRNADRFIILCNNVRYMAHTIENMVNFIFDIALLNHLSSYKISLWTEVISHDIIICQIINSKKWFFKMFSTTAKLPKSLKAAPLLQKIFQDKEIGPRVTLKPVLGRCGIPFFFVTSWIISEPSSIKIGLNNTRKVRLFDKFYAFWIFNFLVLFNLCFM